MTRSVTALSIVLVTSLTASACASKVNVRTEPPGMKVKFGDEDLGVVGPEGRDVEVPLGLGGVPLVLHDGVEHQAVLPRSELSWWVVAAAIGAAVCCAPTLAGAALCVANPAIITAPVACLVGGPGVCVTAVAAPGWITLPLVGAAACLGMTPLGFLFLAERPPENVILKRPVVAPTPGGGDGDMAW